MRAHQPSEKTKAEVEALKSFGHTHSEIATYIGVSVDTLERKYRRELDVAEVSANFKVAKILFEKITINKDLTATIFWLKTRGRWRTEDNRHNVDTNEEIVKEMKALRADLDKKNQKEY